MRFDVAYEGYEFRVKRTHFLIPICPPFMTLKIDTAKQRSESRHRHESITLLLFKIRLIKKVSHRYKEMRVADGSTPGALPVLAA